MAAGTWEDPITVNVTEGNFTIFHELAPYEVAHIQGQRNLPVSPANATGIFVESSFDGVTIADVPLTEIEIPAGFKGAPLFVTGPRFFRVGVTEVGAGENHAADITIALNGGIV